MSEKKITDNSSTISICAMPWVELHVSPTRDTKNCCAQFGDYEKLSGSNFDLDVQFNHPQLTKIRDTFIKGAVPIDCLSCYKMDQIGSSYKSVKSHQWMDRALQDIELGKTNDLKIKFLDLRFSNICNFTCRTCDSFNSSSWEKLNPYVGRPSTKPHEENSQAYHLKLTNAVLKISADLEEIYFAGGEPLIIKEHYLLLDQLIKKGHTHIRLSYNTNLSVLNAFGYDLCELWGQFRSVRLYPSVDGLGSRGEYIREGFCSDTFKKNIGAVKNFVSGLQIVLSAYNIFAIQELVIWAHQMNLEFTISPAYMPLEITVDSLPETVLAQAAKELAHLQTIYSFTSSNQTQIDNTLNYLRAARSSKEKFSRFWAFNLGIDQYYKKRYQDAFPQEFQLIKQSIDVNQLNL